MQILRKIKKHFDLSIIKKYTHSINNISGRYGFNIKVFEKDDYYIIYFVNESDYENNKKKILTTLRKLNNKYLKKLDKKILCGCLYDFYTDEEDIKNDEEIGRHVDLTNKVIKKSRSVYRSNNMVYYISIENNFKKLELINTMPKEKVVLSRFSRDENIEALCIPHLEITILNNNTKFKDASYYFNLKPDFNLNIEKESLKFIDVKYSETMKYGMEGVINV